MPEDVIRRRYDEGLRNFFGRYRGLVDEWQLLDNTEGRAILIAQSSVEEGILVSDPILWTTLQERYTP